MRRMMVIALSIALAIFQCRGDWHSQQLMTNNAMNMMLLCSEDCESTPEPSSALLIAVGVALLALRRKKNENKGLR